MIQRPVSREVTSSTSITSSDIRIGSAAHWARVGLVTMLPQVYCLIHRFGNPYGPALELSGIYLGGVVN
jgi:hypothetical protein